MLDTQIQYNRDMQGYGNMTDVEKKLNREDLIAYKHFDNNQYAMIPGVNTVKRHMDSNIYQSKASRSVDMEEKQRRMA